MFSPFGAPDPRGAFSTSAEFLRHPGIRGAFSPTGIERNSFPGTEVETAKPTGARGTLNRRFFPRKIIGQCKTNRIEMPMFTGKRHWSGAAVAKIDSSRSIARRSNELEQTKSLVVLPIASIAPRGVFDAFGKQTALRLCRGRWFAKNPRESCRENHFLSQKPLPFRTSFHALAFSHFTQCQPPSDGRDDRLGKSFHNDV